MPEQGILQLPFVIRCAPCLSTHFYLNIDIENITINGRFSWLNILTFPVNGYVTPFIMRINAKGFIVLNE
jgi:hypothetical protein